jgi:hypothetical protein
MHNKWLAISAALLLALAAGLTMLHIAGSHSNPGPTGMANENDRTTGDVIYPFDPRDDRLLAGFATDILVGRVTAVAGTIGAPTSAPGQTVPQTQFVVRVLHLVKGTASGTVTVNQVGGVDDLTNRLFLLEGDPLLTTGTTALFVTTFVPDLGWHQIVAPSYADIRIGSPQQRTRLVERFARAAGVELRPTADSPAPPQDPSPSHEPTSVPPTETSVATATETATTEPTATETTVPTATETAIPTETASGE